MRFELYIARKLRLDTGGNRNKRSAPIINIAIAGIVLAIVIMILSLTIVGGFKREIVNKIYSLDSHIKISNQAKGNNQINPIDIDPVIKCIDTLSFISRIYLVVDYPIILKTQQDYNGVTFRGLSENADLSYISNSLETGRIPAFSDSINTEIALSSMLAKKLKIKIGDKILAYTINDKLKVRNLSVVGIYNTDFEDFDKNIVIGNISLIQQINSWKSTEGTYIGIISKDVADVENQTMALYDTLIQYIYKQKVSSNYEITNTYNSNISYFAWLDLLDTNIIIVLILMTLVSAFTLIAGLLIIILERINTIGTLKALGSANHSIRMIFIFLAQKLILKALFIGNIVGLSFSFIQQYFKILKLDASSYYMSYVPIDIDFIEIIILNISIIIISYLTLIIPSYIITNISPSKSIRFE